MLNSLYNVTDKGSFRTLSFILALVLTIFFFANINQFATQLRVVNPLIILMIIWSLCTLWIHGIGFVIKLTFFRMLFLPLLAYVITFLALGNNLLNLIH